MAGEIEERTKQEKFKKRDYSLSGGSEGAIALDEDRLEDRVEEAWWSPEIPRKELRAFMQRSDGPALWHFGLWIVLLAASGYLVFLSWGTWWVVLALLVYGTIYSSSDARWHECGHGTPFRTHWLNMVFYHISSFMTLREAYLWRWSHSRHHTHTIIVGRDPEIQVKRPADLLAIVLDFFYLRSGPPEIRRIVQNTLGRPNSDVRDFVPEAERGKMYWSSRIYVAIIAGFALWSIAIGSLLPILLVALPRFYGGWLHQLLGLTQHAGLAENTFDHRKNTRTVYINPVFRYLYMNMNYHLEHHMLPAIPYHALPRFHKAISDQTPKAYVSLWEVYREMVPALIRQATEDPDYHIERILPAPIQETTQEPPESLDAGATADNWVEVCDVDDLEEEDVIRFDHNGKTYAVYRLKGDEFHATDGLCTHEDTHLAGGLVMDGIIECPKHNGRFDICTGEAKSLPVRVDLRTYPAERRGDKVFINTSD
jgi:MocE subfamily Rieske [2Fe-2S] domain protein